MRVPTLLFAHAAGWRRVALAASIASFTAVGWAIAADPPNSASVVGQYDGGQMEIAAALELTGDGHFHYELSYGALDEGATGKWTVTGDQVLLTSDPVTAPRYVVVSQEKGAKGILRIIIDFKDPYEQQYFSGLITKNDGTVENVQLGIDGLTWPFPNDAPPTSVRLVFDVYGLVSDALALAPNAGYAIRYRFEPNDLGKVEFRSAPLKLVDGVLLLERHGRTLRFRRVKS